MTVQAETDQHSSELDRLLERSSAHERGRCPSTFVDRVTLTSRRLAAAGAGPEVKVAVVADRASTRAVAAWACWSIGATVVAADPGLHDSRRVASLRVGEPDMLVADARGLIQTRDLSRPALRIALTDRAESFSAGLLGEHVLISDICPRQTSPRRTAPCPRPDGDASLLFGPIDVARGVYYTFRELASFARQLLGVGDDDRWGVPGARLGTANAAMSLLLPGLMARATIPASWSTPPDGGPSSPRAAVRGSRG